MAMVGNHHVIVATVMHTTRKELSELVFSVGFTPRTYTGKRTELPVAEKVKRHLELPSWVSCETVAGQ
jgi:hypothetical protein